MSRSIVRPPTIIASPLARASWRDDEQLEVDVQLAAGRRGVPHAVNLRRWARIAFAQGLAPRQRNKLGSVSVALRIVGSSESRRLNRTWRGKDKPTNVLSFPAWDSTAQSAVVHGLPTHLGDIAICAPVVLREAREQRKAAQAHWAHMVIHGVLHLLGYDHEDDHDAERMERRETDILNRLGHPDPYQSHA